jgi:two-component system, cell cycle response regulator DivK
MSEGLILVIEDNAKNLKLVRDVLCHSGYDVIEAGTAEDGIKLAEEQRPGLVLMDIQLPGMDGLEAVKVLKARASTASVPVVAVTAFAMKDDRQRALDAGFDGYIEKPISVQALRAEVRTFLAPARAVDG